MRSFASIGLLALLTVGCGGVEAPSAGVVIGPEELATPRLVGRSQRESDALLKAVARGLAVVAADSGRFKILPRCKAPGRYVFGAQSPISHNARLSDATDIHTWLPWARESVYFALEDGAGVDVVETVVGRFVGSVAWVSQADLVGDCDEATHVVASVVVGAIRVDAGSAAIGSDEPPLAALGSFRSCSTSREGQSAPPPGCNAPLAVELSPLISLRFVADKTHDSAACPKDDPVACGGACLSGQSSACTNLAWMLERGLHVPIRVPHAAVPLYRRACFDRYGLACNNLGILVLRGDGTTRDPKLARTLFTTACSGGNARGCGNLGTLERDGVGGPVNFKAALASLSAGCKGKDARSCSDLGRMLFSGRGSQKNLPAAIVAFTAACKLGRQLGCANLGSALIAGRAADLPKALKLFRAACKAKVGLGCRNLAELNRQGRGVPRNLRRSTHFRKLACRHHDAVSCTVLGHAAETSTEPAAIKSALGWLRRACEHGGEAECAVFADRLGRARSAEGLDHLRARCDEGARGACLGLGDALTRQIGDGLVPDSVATAYRQGCKHGGPLACDRLGQMHDGGRGARRDAALSVDFWRQSCELGRDARCLDLARKHALGVGAPLDVDEARRLLNLSCGRGHQPACAALQTVPKAALGDAR